MRGTGCVRFELNIRVNYPKLAIPPLTDSEFSPAPLPRTHQPTLSVSESALSLVRHRREDEGDSSWSLMFLPPLLLCCCCCRLGCAINFIYPPTTTGLGVGMEQHRGSRRPSHYICGIYRILFQPSSPCFGCVVIHPFHPHQQHQKDYERLLLLQLHLLVDSH